MAILDESRFIERLQFFNGQRLFASDLQDIDEFNREMRWLHNQSMHQPGIGNGFAVSGKKGDRQVTIGPGYAIDVLGREIVLVQDQVETIPPVAGNAKGKPVFYDLTVSYPDNSDLEEVETRDGICLPRGAVRLREEPIFCWVEVDSNENNAKNPQLQKDIKDGLKIILARIEVLNCQLNQPVSIVVRRNARPVMQPYVASGKGKPEWNFVQWNFDLSPHINSLREVLLTLPSIVFADVSSQSTVLLKAKASVVTSEAGFLTVPSYSTNIIGTREMDISDFTEGEVSSSSPSVLVLDRFFVEKAKLDSFDIVGFIIAVASRSLAGTVQLEDLVKELIQSWELSWMGVEE